MRFIQDLPFIDTKMPVCPDGTDISISYYFFNKTDDRNIAILYCQEILYAYRQLIKHTNILDCGRVRIFVDRRWESVAREQFGVCGLESLVSLIDVHEGVHLAGYIPQLDHDDVKECRYRFHNDADLWWISNDESVFDWKAFCDTLDASVDNCIYAQPIQKTEWTLQTNFSQFAPEEDRRVLAGDNLKQIFGLNIPDLFRPMVHIEHKELVAENNLSDLRCIGGWFVGAKKDSKALLTMLDLYTLTNEYLTDDEGFFSILFYLYPDLDISKVLQGTGDPKPHEIKHAALDNYKGMEGVGVINVGTQPFYDKHMHSQRKELATRFMNEQLSVSSDVQMPKTIEIKPNPLQFFGNHIFGTLALDNECREYQLIASPDYGCPGAFLSFSASLPAWTKPLPACFNKDARVNVIFCLSYHPQYFHYDVHVYAKSMIYAYKTLIHRTNILECGSVFFYIDSRIRDIVRPYLEAAVITSQAITFKSDKMIHYAAYIPHLLDEVADYILYFDVDMMWVNLYDDQKFDWIQFCEKMDKEEGDVLGCTVPKTPDSYKADILERCRYDGDTHLQNLDMETLPKSDFRSITGSQNGVRHNMETIQRLSDFYDKYHDTIRDDEALWTTFLTMNQDIEIAPLHKYIPGCGFSTEGMKGYKTGAALCHTGTYMLEHFFNNPYASLFYQNIREEL